jgi:hypothetical protein
MKDIDFDELDKAVNSLMATAPELSASSTDDVKPETVLDVSSQPEPVASTPSEPAEPVVVTTAETVSVTTVPAAPEASSAPAAPVAPAVKRTGRFMDMVHTSSEMKPRPVASTPPSREGLSITPRPNSTTATPSVPAEDAVASSPAPSSETETPDIMPDPIDVSNAADTSMADLASSTEPDITASPVTAESPFIADAKVEKRPLNPGTSVSESFDSQFASELNPDETSDQAPTDTDAGADEPPVTPQVPELSSDLVAIESNDKLEEPVATQSTDTKQAASAVSTTTTPLGATSIAKQYKSQPSTGDQSHAAIYDASEYPEPVAHPAKKKSGWLWVLWVVLLLGVGAGAAALLYFLGIIP